MTPLPKRKLSRLRQGTRRAGHKLTGNTIQKCPHCGQLKMAHRACPSCHKYRP